MFLLLNLKIIIKLLQEIVKSCSQNFACWHSLQVGQRPELPQTCKIESFATTVDD